MRRRIVQVGVAPSGIGLDWLRAIAQAPDWTLAGIVDTRPEHLQSAAERVGLSAERCFTTPAPASSRQTVAAIMLPSAMRAPSNVCRLEAGAPSRYEKVARTRCMRVM